MDSLKLNATRLGARLSENLAEHSRDLGLIDSFASGTGGSSGKYLENGTVLTNQGIEQTKRLLSSKREQDRMEGLKRVMAMMIKNLPVTNFFPLVTSLLSPTTPFEARSLISAYIVHCSDTAPELALLSINAYQKDLSDPNPLTRAGAIKTLSLMNLMDIRELIGLACSKGARDTSWYVRRSTANAIINLYQHDMSKDNLSSLLPILKVLIEGATPLTMGSVLQAWEQLCPTNWNLIHQHYRKWCHILIDVEEWGQCVLLRVLLRYARTFFKDPSIENVVDPDLELLLKVSEVLLQHHNPAVTSAAIKVQFYVGTRESQRKIVKPLLRLLRTTTEIKSYALQECLVVAQTRPDLFKDYLTEFFVRLTEPNIFKQTRLKILISLVSTNNVDLVLSELFTYVNDVDEQFASNSISAIGQVAIKVSNALEKCLKVLTKLCFTNNDTITSQSVLVLRSLVNSQHSTTTSISRRKIIETLVTLLHSNKLIKPDARASVYWIVGQFAKDENLIETIGPDTVRMGAKHFTTESTLAKLQLLTMSAKLVLLSRLSKSTTDSIVNVLSMLFSYITTLARYDSIYEVRDRSRFLKSLIEQTHLNQDSNLTLKQHDTSQLMLNEEQFKKGVSVEELGGGELNQIKQINEETSLTLEQLETILYQGKISNTVDQNENQSSIELGTFNVMLPTKKLLFFSNQTIETLPSYSTNQSLSSSVRDPPNSSSSDNIQGTNSTTMTLRGFGSDSFNNVSTMNSNTSSGRSSPIVLVPTTRQASTATGSKHVNSGGQKRGYVDLDDFLNDEPNQSDDTSNESEQEEEEEEDDDVENEDETESEEESDDNNSPESGSEVDSNDSDAKSS
ncbi:AP-3 complex subunit beta [Microbotryomycetes sp. JL221]|nr:AP-3 complex subunit beta [Microbotryomycetes sp. JL221]